MSLVLMQGVWLVVLANVIQTPIEIVSLPLGQRQVHFVCFQFARIRVSMRLPSCQRVSLLVIHF